MKRQKGPKDVATWVIIFISLVTIWICFMLIVSTEAKAGSQQSTSSTNHANVNDAISQSISQNRDLVNVDMSDRSSNHIDNPKLPVATAVSPGLVAGGDEMCVGSTSGAVQFAGFGGSAGSTHESNQCNRRRNATKMAQMGEVKLRMNDRKGALLSVRAAELLLCQDESMRMAYEMVGLPCDINPEMMEDKITEIKEERQRRIDEAFSKGFAQSKSGKTLYFDGNN